MTQTLAQVASIRSAIDGGFQAMLFAASGGVTATSVSSPTSTASAASLASSGSLAGLLLGSPAPSAGAGSVPSAVYPSGNAAIGSLSGLVSPLPAVLATAPVPAGPSGAEVVSTAQRYLGVPYVWGGASPSTGFDCSGLVQYVYGQLGISLPRTSQEQANVGIPVASLSQATPGDLLIFNSPADGANGHVGIYIGGGKMIDAPYTGADVRVDSVSAAGVPTTIRQIVPPEPVTAAFTSPPGAGGSLSGIFAQATATYGLPPGLLQAVATVESGMSSQAVSPAGAEGLMQLMPSTAAAAGVNPLDPAQAIPAAAKILSGYLADFGSLPLALAAYNAGPGAVTRYGGIPPYPQTQAYVSKVLSLMGGA